MFEMSCKQSPFTARGDDTGPTTAHLEAATCHVRETPFLLRYCWGNLGLLFGWAAPRGGGYGRGILLSSDRLSKPALRRWDACLVEKESKARANAMEEGGRVL